MFVAGRLEMRGSEGIKSENSDTRRKHVGYMRVRHRKLDIGLTKSVSSIIALISVVLVDFTRSLIASSPLWDARWEGVKQSWTVPHMCSLRFKEKSVCVNYTQTCKGLSFPLNAVPQECYSNSVTLAIL